ncbi:MAG TPA: hypothetical protein VF407_00660 [Polyangiaceae bacterium]
MASYVRRFSAKTILGAIFVAGAAATTGCSGNVESQQIPPVSCELASASFVASSVQLGVKTNAGSGPDVSIRGRGFPAGAKVSIGYFGLPAPTSGDPTVDLDFADVVTVNDDGTFALTQPAVHTLVDCSADQLATTIGVAVGADGVLGGTTVPEAFWCANASTETFASVCK